MYNVSRRHEELLRSSINLMNTLSPDVSLRRASDHITFLICGTIFKFSVGFTKISAQLKILSDRSNMVPGQTDIVSRADIFNCGCMQIYN